ncbi:MAG TPA: PRC-barrel domain-containing protein [Candidatus Thermoplasmatota archaeon]|nr:PRC-barrel domain-containing protein [Candidatus Thermoplasmatota archaeon]
MHAIEPDMVLGKEAVDGSGSSLGTVVDVGLYTHSRVKFLVVSDGARANVPIRRVGVEDVDGVDADVVRLRVR